MTAPRQRSSERLQEPARILISALPGEVRAACLCGGRLEDLLILRDDRPRLLGNIYLGRVQEISAGLDAAFVDIGLGTSGFLPRGEAPGRKQLGHALSDGDPVTVRVVREASGGKGVRLTTRIANPPENLETLAENAAIPSLLAQGDDPLMQFIARRARLEAVIVDDSGAYNDLKGKLEGQASGRVLTFDPALRPLFERERAEEQIDALLSPEVGLPGGGSLLVEPVQTLTAIDVNLGAMATGGSAQAQALGANLEAVAEIARQLRLRGISGLIVVDFLELKDKRAREQVVAALRAALEEDDEPCQVRGMSSSGLLEMTRRRGAPTLAETLTEPAGEQGSGRRRDVVTLAFEALRRARGAADSSPGCTVEIRAPQAVLAALRDGVAAPARQMVETRIGQPIRLEAPGSNAENPAGTVEILARQR